MNVQPPHKLHHRSTTAQIRMAARTELDERTNILNELQKVDTKGMSFQQYMEYQRKYQTAIYRVRCITTREERKRGIDFTHITTI